MTDPNQPQYPQQPQQDPYGQQPYPQQPQQPQQPQVVYIQEPKKKKKWPWLVVIPVLLFGGCTVALASGGSDNTDKVSDAPAAVDGAPAADAGPMWAGKTGNDTGALAGQTVDRKGVVTSSSPLEAYDNSYRSLLCTNVTIQNNTGKNQSFGTYDWKILLPGGTIRDSTYASDRQMLSSGETAPGGKTSGEVCFEQAPGNPSGQYVVLFEKSFSLSTDRIGWVNNL